MKKSLLKDKKNISICVSIVDDIQMKKLNKEYAGNDYSTDVLSFEIGEDDGSCFYLGDVIINKDQARKQMEGTLEEEISKLVAHGTLHLLGVHHDI